MLVARKYYGEACGGFSIPASEHSTITSWGKDGECDAMKNMLEQYPVGLVACVSDSFDVFKACEEYWGGALKELVQAREGKGFLVIRPDSGPPVETTLKIFEILDARFGMTTNTMGYKVLPSYLRMIWGDGIDYESLVAICESLTKAGYSTDNIAFGSGGGLLQKLNRDTQKCAFKCSELRKADGSVTLVYKDPITDKGKQSKKGRMTVEKGADGKLTTVTEGKGDPAKDVMHEVFRDGVCLNTTTLDEVKALAAIDGK